MNRVDALVAKFRAATATDTRSLAIYRILFGCWMILFFRSWAWIADAPPTFFIPPFLSLANLFHSFPPLVFFRTLDVLSLLFACMLTIGLKTRFSTIGLLLVKMAGSSFMFSFGKIDHLILIPCALFAMSFSEWGAHWSVDSLLRKTRPQPPARETDLALLGVFIAFGFFTAGYGKALVWLDFNTDTGGFLAWLLVRYHTTGSTFLLASWAVHFPWPRMYEALDICGVVFELGFFWALMQRRRWQAWIAVWCGFHLLNTLVLNIPFLPYALVVMAFVPWTALIGPEGRRAWAGRVGLLVTTLGLLLVLALRYAPHFWVAHLDLDPIAIGLFSSALCWAGLCVVFVWQALRPIRAKSRSVAVLPAGIL
jgi:hypothetical protein